MPDRRCTPLASFPGPHPASRRLEYSNASDGKLGEGLGTRLVIIRAMKSQTTDSLHVHISLSCTKSSIAECEKTKKALVQW